MPAGLKYTKRGSTGKLQLLLLDTWKSFFKPHKSPVTTHLICSFTSLFSYHPHSFWKRTVSCIFDKFLCLFCYFFSCTSGNCQHSCQSTSDQLCTANMSYCQPRIYNNLNISIYLNYFTDTQLLRNFCYVCLFFDNFSIVFF